MIMAEAKMNSKIKIFVGFLIPIISVWVIWSTQTVLAQQVESNNLQKAKKIYEEGLDYAQRGDYKLGMAKFEEAIQLNSNLAEAHHDLAACYRIFNIKLKAIEEMKKAILLAPAWTSYRVDLGKIYIEQEGWQEAISELNVLRDLDPEAAKTLEGNIISARIMPIKKKQRDGIFILEKEFKNKEISNLITVGGECLLKGSTSEAEDTFKKIISLDPQESIGYWLLSKLYCDIKEYRKAAKLLESFLERNPNKPEILHMLGAIYYTLGEYDKAILTWEKIKDLDRIIYLTIDRFIEKLRKDQVQQKESQQP